MRREVRHPSPFWSSHFFATVSADGFASLAASALSAVRPSVVSLAEMALSTCRTVSFAFGLVDQRHDVLRGEEALRVFQGHQVVGQDGRIGGEQVAAWIVTVSARSR